MIIQKFENEDEKYGLFIHSSCDFFIIGTYSRVSITRTATGNKNLFELKRHSSNGDSIKRVS